MEDLDIDMFYNKGNRLFIAASAVSSEVQRKRYFEGNEDVRKKYKAMYKRFDKFDFD